LLFDSEHSDIFQTLKEQNSWNFLELMIIASGWSFHDFTSKELTKIKLSDIS
jgi:1-deoxy-D-xylulose 5-phosphate reductoisomerase